MGTEAAAIAGVYHHSQMTRRAATALRRLRRSLIVAGGQQYDLGRSEVTTHYGEAGVALRSSAESPL